jgi:hypothetical protein
MCPLVEQDVLYIDSVLRNTINKEEYTYPQSRVAIDLATEKGTPIETPMTKGCANKFCDIIKLDSDAVIDACGTGKQCKIYIKVRNKGHNGVSPCAYEYIGSILIDIENSMRIISITPLNGNSPYTMTVNSPMNNTIIFHN